MKHVGKTLLYTLFLIILLQNNLFSQWRKIENIPSGYNYNDDYYLDVFFLSSNPNLGWICGYKGKVLRTTDRGKTWTGSIINNADQLESIIFLDENIGYCVDISESAIYKSIDGGMTWKNISPVLPPDMNIFWGTHFITKDVGILLGGSSCQSGYTSNFFFTKDGGNTWAIKEYLPTIKTKLSDGILISETGKGYAISSGLLWESNGNNQWQIKEKTGSNNWHEELTYVEGSFLIPTSEGCSGSTAVENGSGDIRMKTSTDEKWNIFPTDYPMFGSFLIDGTHGWAVGMRRSVYYTDDGGKTWETRNCGIIPDADLDDIWFINENEGWLVGTGIYKYTPVVKDTLSVKIKLPICENEFTFAKLDSAYDMNEWYINGKRMFLDRDSVAVKAGDSIKVYVENRRKPFCGWTKTYYVDYNKAPKFSISPEDTIFICNNKEKTLSINEEFSQYLWSTGDTTQSIIINKPGTYSAIVFDSIGCSNEKEIEVFPAPKIDYKIQVKGKTHFCKYDTVSFIISGEYDSFEWYEEIDDSTNILLSNSDTLLVTTTKKIYVEMKSKYDCIEKSKFYYITVRNDSNRFAYYFSTEEQNEKFNENRYPEIICIYLTINNITNQNQSLSSAYFKRNISFSVPPGQLPVVITPKNSFDLQVCFTGYKLEDQRDTLLINDKCTIHKIPLIAKTNGGRYNATSNCEIEIDAETIDIDKSFIPFFDKPYPNPTNKKITISGIGNKSDLENTRFELYDYIGNKYIIPHYNIDYKINSCKYQLNLNVPDGLYLLKIISNKNESYYQIIKIK